MQKLPDIAISEVGDENSNSKIQGREKDKTLGSTYLTPNLKSRDAPLGSTTKLRLGSSEFLNSDAQISVLEAV